MAKCMEALGALVLHRPELLIWVEVRARIDG